MRNIIYIGNFELPDKNAAAHRVVNNAKALRELGFNVILMDTRRDNGDSILDSKSECFGFVTYSMKHNNKRFYSISDFISVYNSFQNPIYAVVAYNYPGIALGRLLHFCRKNGIKLYADCTEWYGFVGINPFVKIITGIDSFIRMELVQPRVDGMIAISRYLEDYYKKKVKTICVPPLTDLDDDKWCEHSVTNNEKMQILYAGSPGKHKDKLNKIIESIYDAQLDSIVFRIIGITKEQFLEYYPEDEHIIKDLDNIVIFMGRQPHDLVIHYLKQSDFSMFYREITRVTMAGFPTKFSEAITCGTPVITNRTSDLAEYLREGENGYWIDDIKKDVAKLFKSGKTIRCKNNVDCTIFDYRNYIEIISTLFADGTSSK